MRVAYCPLLYGAAYLHDAIASVASQVDRVYILYTASPSFGHPSSMVNPDSEEQLRSCVEPFGSLVQWHRGTWHGENHHRNAIMDLAPDADLILPIDSDEIWNADDLSRCIAEASKSSARNFLIQGWFHFWRSFGWACRDVWAPVRIINPRGSGEATLQGCVYHFGYAISEQLMRFKWSCHGHIAELRPEWMEDIFVTNRRTDCHPVVRDWWNAQPFDRRELPISLRLNPNYDLDLIV